jgi:hypothetical protein
MEANTKNEVITAQQLADFRSRCRRLRRMFCDAEGQIALLERALNLGMEASDPRWTQYMDHLHFVIDSMSTARKYFAHKDELSAHYLEIQEWIDRLLEKFRSILESIEASGRKMTIQLGDQIARTLYLTDYAIAEVDDVIEQHSRRR